MRRDGKNSPLERASWDEVLDTIVAHFRSLQTEYVKDAVREAQDKADETA
jgi:assimilatory nitrate reductase catalytic subunit